MVIWTGKENYQDLTGAKPMIRPSFMIYGIKIHSDKIAICAVSFTSFQLTAISSGTELRKSYIMPVCTNK